MKAVYRRRTHSPQSQSPCIPLEREARQDSTLPRGKLWFLALVKVPVWAPLFPKCEPHARALRTDVGHRSLGQASGEECGPCLRLRKAGILERFSSDMEGTKAPLHSREHLVYGAPRKPEWDNSRGGQLFKKNGRLSLRRFTLSLLPKVRPPEPIWSPSSVTSSLFWHPTVPMYGSQEQ